MYNKVYSNVLLAIISFSINFNYCRTVEQRLEQYPSRKLNINTVSNNSSNGPPIQQPVFSTSNTLSPPPILIPLSSSLSSSPTIIASDTEELQFVQEKYKLLEKQSVNKTALFKSIIKKRDINTHKSDTNTDIDSDNNWQNINYASRSLLDTEKSTLSSPPLTQFLIINPNNNNVSEYYASTVINDTTQHQSTTNIINNNNLNSKNDSNTDNYQICDEFEDENCVIDHNVVCVGDSQYCNLTYEQYTGLLLEYITPTTSEWILIVSHSVVFIMGLVSILF